MRRDDASPQSFRPTLVGGARPGPAAAMAANPVRPVVNNTRNDGPEVIAPVVHTASQSVTHDSLGSSA